MGLFDFLPFFKSNPKILKTDFAPLFTDFHSHLIPGVDDGVETIEESIEVITELYHLGFKKIVTTPHVMREGYQNSPETLLPGLKSVQQAILDFGIPVQLELAAEYYFDENFEKLVAERNLLTFGNKYVLFELPFMNKPPNLKEVLFDLQTAGYKPMIAHPERYAYYHERGLKSFHEFKEMGVVMQVNLLSLLGVYSPVIRQVSRDMVAEKLVDVVSTDCHRMKHINLLKECLKDKFMVNFIENYPLKNNEILD